MIEIPSAWPYCEGTFGNLAGHMEELLSDVGYSVTVRRDDFLQMEKHSEFFRMKAKAALKQNGRNIVFGCQVLDDNGQVLMCEKYSDGMERPAEWRMWQPDYGDIGRFCCGLAEAYVSARTNIKPILGKCKKLRIPGARTPVQKRIAEIRERRQRIINEIFEGINYSTE